MNHDAIGGYFELELPPPRGERYPDALRYQSARAAFLALLLAGRPGRFSRRGGPPILMLRLPFLRAASENCW